MALAIQGTENNSRFVKFLFLYILGKTQEEGLRRVEELKKELGLLKEAKKEETKRCTELQEEHAKLTEELAKERVRQTFSCLLGLLLFFVNQNSVL